ncbi:MAG: hypothetical protein ACLUB2_04765 [Butyricicoccus pullicaecorum]
MNSSRFRSARRDFEEAPPAEPLQVPEQPEAIRPATVKVEPPTSARMRTVPRLSAQKSEQRARLPPASRKNCAS